MYHSWSFADFWKQNQGQPSRVKRSTFHSTLEEMTRLLPFLIQSTALNKDVELWILKLLASPSGALCPIWTSDTLVTRKQDPPVHRSFLSKRTKSLPFIIVVNLIPVAGTKEFHRPIFIKSLRTSLATAHCRPRLPHQCNVIQTNF